MAESGRVTEPGFGVDRELNTLQNARIAGRQMQIADERRSTWRVWPVILIVVSSA